MNIFNWFNNQSRWSDLGHILTGFFLISILQKFLGFKNALIFLTILVIIKEFILDKHSLREGLIKSIQYLMGMLLTLLI